jgi:hypothetical protein
VTAARILMTGSRDWTDQQKSEDALNAALVLVGASARESVLVHGNADGADRLLASTAARIGMAAEAHPADWNTHVANCPPSHAGQRGCKGAGHRRNAAMIAAGADVCLAFPTHGYHLAPGEDRNRTSRGTWDCAEKAKDAGLPTLVVWGKEFYPFGEPALQLLTREANRKGLTLGAAGQLPIIEAWLPF